LNLLETLNGDFKLPPVKSQGEKNNVKIAYLS